MLATAAVVMVMTEETEEMSGVGLSAKTTDGHSERSNHRREFPRAIHECHPLSVDETQSKPPCARRISHETGATETA
jgi:hypothetical protein